MKCQWMLSNKALPKVHGVYIGICIREVHYHTYWGLVCRMNKCDMYDEYVLYFPLLTEYEDI